MQGYAIPEDNFRRRAAQFVDQLESEFRNTVDYIDRAVVPEVRREAASAARLLAGHLDRLADRMDAAGRKQGL